MLDIGINCLHAAPLYYQCSECGYIYVDIGVLEDMIDDCGLSKDNPIKYVCEDCEEW